MIYPNKKLEIAVTEYMTQIDGKPHKYYDDDFFLTPISLGKMYLNKYTNKKYQFTINPFKARIL